MATDPTKVERIIRTMTFIWTGAGAVTAPSDFDTALVTGWTAMGGVNADGLKETSSVETTDYVDSDGTTYLTTVDSSKVELEVVFTESTDAVMDWWHGDAAVSGRRLLIPAVTGGLTPMVSEAYMASGTVRRRYYPATEISERTEQVAKVGPETWGGKLTAYSGTVASGISAPRAEWRGIPA